MSAPRPLSHIRLPELDGIRGFALSMILIWHFVVCGVDPNSTTVPAGLREAAQWLTITWSSIDMFFVLSGFLIAGILMDHRDSTNYFSVFYVRRAFRIMPLYTLWVLGYFVLSHLPLAAQFPWLFEHRLPGWGYLTYLQNMTAHAQDRFGPHWMGITWSLAVEEQFYVLLPTLVFLLPRRWLPLAALLAVVSAMPLRLITRALHPGHEWAGWFPIWCRWDSLFLGVLLAWARRRPWWEQTGSREGLALASLVALATGGWLVFLTSKRWMYPGNAHIQTYGLTVIAVFYAALLFLTLHVAALARFFARRFWVFMGTISYGLYIFHMGVLGLAHGWLLKAEPRFETWPQMGVTASALAVTVLLAWASYRFFEAPLQKLGHRWKYQPRAA